MAGGGSDARDGVRIVIGLDEGGRQRVVEAPGRREVGLAAALPGLAPEPGQRSG